MDPALMLVGALMLLGGGKKAAAKAAAAEKKTEKKKADTDGAALLKRANQPNALPWASVFKGTGVDAPALLADAYARWAGIESSGDPYTPSSLGERGLFQIGRTMFAELVKAGVFSQADWDKLIARTTPKEEHARMAQRLSNWLWDRSKKYVKSPPGDFISAVWYAKLYHQRPVDVRDMGGHGDALHMARELAERWKDDDEKMHRLRAANVVAFGVSEP